VNCDSAFVLQLWLMKGQIEEQHGNDINAVRDAYKQGVSIFLSIYRQVVCSDF
jgi:hypothetical protein